MHRECDIVKWRLAQEEKASRMIMEPIEETFWHFQVVHWQIQHVIHKPACPFLHAVMNRSASTNLLEFAFGIHSTLCALFPCGLRFWSVVPWEVASKDKTFLNVSADKHSCFLGVCAAYSTGVAKLRCIFLLGNWLHDQVYPVGIWMGTSLKPLRSFWSLDLRWQCSWWALHAAVIVVWRLSVWGGPFHCD